MNDSDGETRRATIKKRGKKPGKSAMVVAVDSYLESPSGGTASDLYRAARKLSAHKPHCALQLLDTLAEHLLAATPEALQLLELCYLFARKTAIGYPVSVSALRNGCEVDTGLNLQLLELAEMIKISAGVRIYAKEMKKIKDFYLNGKQTFQ
ncbi:uncharacterized protein PITG_09365 [Phytophthora infestans T30-4]|uniref:Uncharacterized protein n=1 Tax=Phytophthora infestans (strain T30-4) TaxID=403677 RepID=D0NBI0_PHYIT|nr:uncharacterized protein PITG_09365 [Phytophthora infestans T30-4]EEY55409.1 conserved hypothetical protein [Phytophthora infestans T30-4]|eukprot:XP_002903633.1 conserved hypothetical protein [Phytophthora infestans T30-4]